MTKKMRRELPAYLPGEWVDVLHKTEDGDQWFCGQILQKMGRRRVVAFADGETAAINLVHKEWRMCRHSQPMKEGVCEEERKTGDDDDDDDDNLTELL